MDTSRMSAQSSSTSTNEPNSGHMRPHYNAVYEMKLTKAINALAELVPGPPDSKMNKGETIRRVIHYIVHAKEIEVLSLETWTLERLIAEGEIAKLTVENNRIRALLERVRNEGAKYKEACESAGAAPAPEDLSAEIMSQDIKDNGIEEA
jgi:Helix-loop-helix DNA-binding domain